MKKRCKLCDQSWVTFQLSPPLTSHLSLSRGPDRSRNLSQQGLRSPGAALSPLCSVRVTWSNTCSRWSLLGFSSEFENCLSIFKRIELLWLLEVCMSTLGCITKCLSSINDRWLKYSNSGLPNSLLDLSHMFYMERKRKPRAFCTGYIWIALGILLTLSFSLF